MESFVASIVQEFSIHDDQLRHLSQQFTLALENGLSHPITDTDTSSSRPFPSLPMLPAFVTSRINGQEQGTFLALDLGGTNLRVCKVELAGNGVISLQQHQMRITEDMKAKPAQELFDYLADFIRRFLDHYPITEEGEMGPNLGFTFSFGVKQTRIDNGVLLTWTKGFTSSGVEGKDVSALLQDALYRLDVKVNVVAIVNDTVGALLAGAYQNPLVNVGVIFGTGTNAAYYEHMEKVAALEDAPAAASEMIINTEWGAFDADNKSILPYTRFDNRLDRESADPRRQVFEKMISGKYLGEVVRLILLEAIDRMILFGARSSEAMDTPYRFDTAYVSKCVEDSSEDLHEIGLVFEQTLGLPPCSVKDRQHIQTLCKAAIERAALLSSAALASLLLKRPDLLQDGKQVGVGADGSVYEHLPGFVDGMKRGLHVIMGDVADQVFFVLAKDGSGIGAALTALVVTK